MNKVKITKYIILILFSSSLSVFNLFVAPNDHYLEEEKITFDEIKMGKYEVIGPADGKISEEIEWYVISEDRGKKLLISKYILMPAVFNDDTIVAKWENSFVREYLNNIFYYEYFTEQEREKILPTNVPVDKNTLYKTGTGNPTTDNIFILSNSELKKYLGNNMKATCGKVATAYHCSNYYWTRTNGYTNYDICCVDPFGNIEELGYPSTATRTGVRPAMWIKK